MVNVQLQVRGLNELVGGFGLLPEVMAAENQRAMVLATHVAEAEIKALTPRKTGRLFSAWTPDTQGVGFATIGVVGDAVSYAPAVEEGSAAHDISALGTALKIPARGSMATVQATGNVDFVFFKKVHHPGTKGQHMASRGLEAARPEIVALFSRAATQAIQAALGKFRSLTSNVIGQL